MYSCHITCPVKHLKIFLGKIFIIFTTSISSSSIALGHIIMMFIVLTENIRNITLSLLFLWRDELTIKCHLSSVLWLTSD